MKDQELPDVDAVVCGVTVRAMVEQLPSLVCLARPSDDPFQNHRQRCAGTASFTVQNTTCSGSCATFASILLPGQSSNDWLLD
jgi:hypothetical protein